MSAFIYGIYVQWKIDVRNKEILLFYYLVPLAFYLFMSSFFTSIMDGFFETLIVSMSVFGLTMGGILGSGMAICTHYGTTLRKAYQVGGIPFWAYLIQNLLSSLLHLMIMVTILLISAQVIFSATLSISYGMFYVAMIAYATLCILLSSLLALCLRKTNKMTMAAQGIFLPSILLSGVMVPTNMLGEAFQTLSNIFPASWVIQWVDGTSFYGIVIGVAIVVVFCLNLFCLKHVQRKEITE